MPDRSELEAVWRVCRVIKGDCQRCPATIVLDGEECVHGCFHHAQECINTVETGNPWRKTEDVRAPWTVLPDHQPSPSGEGWREQVRAALDVRAEKNWSDNAARLKLDDAVDAVAALLPPEIFRAAWALCDDTEGTVFEDEFGEHYHVPKDSWDRLAKAVEEHMHPTTSNKAGEA